MDGPVLLHSVSSGGSDGTGNMLGQIHEPLPLELEFLPVPTELPDNFTVLIERSNIVKFNHLGANGFLIAEH